MIAIERDFFSLQKKLLVAVLVTSSIATAIVTAINLSLEYKLQKDIQESEITYLENSFISSLELSLWTLDKIQTNAQVTGMMSIPSVTNIEILKNDGSVIFSKSKDLNVESLFHKTYPLKFENDGYTTDLGTLKITVSNDLIYDHLKNAAIKILLFQAIKTFVVSFILLYIFKVFVTNNISQISKYFSKHTPISLTTPPLVINKNSRQIDEIDLLVDSVNKTVSDSISYIKEREGLIEKSQKANDAKTLFLASISHELRTPLNSILGMTDIISEQAKNHVNPTYIDIHKKSCSHLLYLINDLLDLTKIEAGEFNISVNQTPLRSTIELPCNMLKTNFQDKENTFEINLIEPLPKSIQTDASRLSQVILNLLTNANKFTTKGKITLTAKYKDGWLFVDISDSGIGIPENRIKDIFAPFTQIDASLSKKYGGTGIGLSITKGIVNALGGSIKVSSEFGKGTTFSFQLPAAQGSLDIINKEEKSGISDTEIRDIFKGKRILSADDTEDNQIVIQAFLKKFESTLTLVENGKIAVEMHSQAPFDLILMDIQMPQMDGFEATRRIRELENNNVIPRSKIIALTALTNKENVEQILNSGFDGYLSKPVNRAQLIEALALNLKEQLHSGQKKAA